jgi:cytochrome c2
MAASLETNKALAALLTAGIIASGSGVISRILYHPSMPEENAYVIEVAEATGDGEAAAEAETPPLPVLLAAASPEDGEGEARACAACHNFEQGGANKIGPALWGVVGRDIASVEGFAYSDPLLAMEGEWTFEQLYGFIHDPKGFVPGTKMAFAGIRDPGDLADVLVYLRSLADEPVPLPEADQAEAQPAESAEAEPAAEAGAGEEGAEAQSAEAAAAQESTEGQAAEAGAAQEAEGAPAAAAEASAGAAPDPGELIAALQEASEQAAPEQAPAEQAPAEEAAPEEQAPSEQAALEQAAPEQAAPAAAAGVGGLLAQADADEGAKAARKCAACHTFDEGGANRIGPPLWDVVGRDIAALDFAYSDALSEKDGAWDYQTLDAFLAEPKEWAPGTKMAFAGIRKPEERADVILYLRSLSNEPAPLP